MFNLNEKQKSIFFYYIWSSSGSYTLEKKYKINYYAKKIGGKSWVSL